MKKLTINFGGIRTVENTLFKNVSVIVVNGGGGMGGSREKIYCEVLYTKENGFVVVREVMTGEELEINSKYIGTIRKVNITKVYFTHTNSNFPSGKITEWYSHRVNTEVDFVSKEGYVTPEMFGKNEEYNLEEIHRNNHQYQ